MQRQKIFIGRKYRFFAQIIHSQYFMHSPMKKTLYFWGLIGLIVSVLFVQACGGKSKTEEERKIAIEDSIRKATTQATTYHVDMNRDPKNLSMQKVWGYRVQIFTGKNRDEASKMKALFINLFPDVDNYLVYEEPNYKVRVGDFLAKIGARELCEKVNKNATLNGAFVVKSMVNAVIPPPPADTIGDDQLVYYTLIDSTGKEYQVPVLKTSSMAIEQEKDTTAAAEMKVQMTSQTVEVINAQKRESEKVAAETKATELKNKIAEEKFKRN